jgi:Transmembrane domain of unknown function (DUF3566)
VTKPTDPQDPIRTEDRFDEPTQPTGPVVSRDADSVRSADGSTRLAGELSEPAEEWPGPGDESSDSAGARVEPGEPDAEIAGPVGGSTQPPVGAAGNGQPASPGDGQPDAAAPLGAGPPEEPTGALPPPWQRTVVSEPEHASGGRSPDAADASAGPAPSGTAGAGAYAAGPPAASRPPSPVPRTKPPRPGPASEPPEAAAAWPAESPPRTTTPAFTDTAPLGARSDPPRPRPRAERTDQADLGNARTVSLDPGGVGDQVGPESGGRPRAATWPTRAPGGFGMSWPRNRRPRQASLQLKRLDPWSVLKIALVLAVVLYLVWLVAVGVLYGVLDGIGVWDRLNGQYADLVTEQAGDRLISAGRVFGAAAIIGAVNSLLFAVSLSVGAFVYNVSADLVGGVEVTLSERDQREPGN